MAKNKRLIDADALYKPVTEKYKDIVAGCYPYNIVAYDMAQLVKDAPTVDAVEVVHGRWHDVYLMTPWIATGICSHCNLKSYINPDFPFAKYCPNCGAKMDGDGNGT